MKHVELSEVYNKPNLVKNHVQILFLPIADCICQFTFMCLWADFDLSSDKGANIGVINNSCTCSFNFFKSQTAVCK